MQLAQKTTRILCSFFKDNQNTMQLAQNSVTNSDSQHIGERLYFFKILSTRGTWQ